MSLDHNYDFVRFEENRSLQEAKSLYNQAINDALDFHSKYHEFFITRNCPICGSSKYHNIEQFHNTYEIAKCRICASMFVNPVPSLNALGDFYNNSEYCKLLNKLYRKRKKKPANFIIDNRVGKVTEYLNHMKDKDKIRILEIGCSSGSFLSKLKSSNKIEFGFRSIEYHGIDIDKNAIEKNNDKEQNFTLINSSIEEYATKNIQPYDIIVYFELIEHLIDPYDFMLNTRKLLKDDGIVVFTTQNLNSLDMIMSDYNSYRILAHSLFPPMHLNAFSTFNITHFSIRSGFSVLEITTPGKLDIDMVAVLKENIKDEAFKALAELDDRTKGLIQYLICKVNVSSHMQCVLKKS